MERGRERERQGKERETRVENERVRRDDEKKSDMQGVGGGDKI